MNQPQEPNRNSASTALVEIIPLGDLDQVAAAVAAANLQAILGLNADHLAPWPDPEYAYMESRHQYDAGLILKHLASADGGPPLKLGITAKDLCIPILTFVYGESQLGGRAAVVSLHRLDQGARQLLYQRVAKICTHEMGHVLGLGHCWEPDCLMRFSKDLGELDRLRLNFCPTCEYELARLRRALLARCGRQDPSMDISGPDSRDSEIR